jgi:thiol-disulfide isomerase/thioredoxin
MLHRYMRRLLFVITLFLFLGCNTPHESSVISEIKLKDLEGNAVSLQEFKGKVVFLNFWATWCGPCVREMPAIENAQKHFKDEPIVFLLSSSESIDKIKRFKEKKAYDFHYLQLDMGMEQLNIYSLPTTYVFNRKGKLILNETGARMWDNDKNLEELKKIIENDEI